MHITTFCKYAPRELMAGFSVWSEPFSLTYDELSLSDALIHPTLCGYAKTVLQAACKKQIKAAVFTTCCDAMNRVYDVLKQEADLDFLYLLDLPHKTDQAAIRTYARTLVSFGQALQEKTGNRFELEKALLAVEKAADKPTASAPYVKLMGAHASPELVEKAASTLGVQVENVTCSGPRMLHEPPRALFRSAKPACPACEPEEQDSLERFCAWYAEALLLQKPCMRMQNTVPKAPASAITSLSAADSPLAPSAAHSLATTHQPILYHTMQFCEFWPFEYKALSDKAPTNIAKIETDGTRSGTEQLTTRLEAFKEQLAPGLFQKDTTHPFSIGIDIGSTTTKGVVVEKATQTIVAKALQPTGSKATKAAQNVLKSLYAACPKSIDAPITATGYGRETLKENAATITEISAHARGARALFPEVATIIDIGGQDSKVITLTKEGKVKSFVMNDKCAAGTGRFLDTMCRVLEISQEQMSRAGVKSTHPHTISSMCTVFAESEVVSLVAQDAAIPDIVGGLAESVAQKTAALVSRQKGHAPFLFTGGVSQNASVHAALCRVLDQEIKTDVASQYCGALGAALLG